ncbi:MAG: DUF1194 domain-containing protein, partial [Burkholderiales bacterium]
VSTPFLIPTTQAQNVDVDLNLVLAVDVSSSIDTEEVRLQREGYISALQHPGVLHAIKQGRYGRIALAYFEWSDADKQTLVVDWMVLAGAASARQFAERLRPAPIVRGHFTSISSAIIFATQILDQTTFRASRRVIDISGDGKNNDGPPLASARDHALQQNITINGLPIIDLSGFIYRGTPPVQIAQYYRNHVIGGTDAFTISVKKPSDFDSAISRKLFREIVTVTSNRTIAQANAE